jgi:SAM-dependent methyltransferase
VRLGSFYRSEFMDRLGLLPVRHDRVLDVGCHDGMMLHRMVKGIRVGVDIRPVPIHPVRYVRADGARLPFLPESFDRIYALEVIEHVRARREVVAAALRCLRPGGTFILSVPHRGMQVFPGFLTPWLHERWGHGKGFRGLTEDDVRAILPAEKVADVRFFHWRGRAFLRGYLGLRLAWRLCRGMGRRWAHRCVLSDLRGSRRFDSGYMLFAIIRKA